MYNKEIFALKGYLFMKKVIYVLIFLLLFAVGCATKENSKTNDIYLIPEGYEGSYVFYNVGSVKGKC